jgi:Domain of unknown function (DUF4333)
MVRADRRVGSLRLVVPIVLFIAGCGSSGTASLSTGPIERAIASSILRQHRLRTTVECPTDVSRRVGATFTCVADLDVGSYPVAVTETNSAGHVRYESKAPLIALAVARVRQAIEQSILTQRKLHATVTCPAEVLQQAGVSFVCSAVIRGKRYPFAVTEIDGRGHVRYVGRRS